MLQKIKNFFSSLKSNKKIKVLSMDESGVSPQNPINAEYIFDLKGSYYGNIYYGNATATSEPSENGIDNYSKRTLKLKVKPIDVLNEIEQPPKALALANLDDKISLLRDKEELIRNNYAKRELLGLIECLENRKKYAEFSKFFSLFNTTTLEKINILLEKHELVMKDADIFIPEFPIDAIKMMREYMKNIKKLTGKKAVFYVIATSDNFKEVDGKRDPILLAQSPFGFYYDILGAWDKEMLLLSEL